MNAVVADPRALACKVLADGPTPWTRFGCKQGETAVVRMICNMTVIVKGAVIPHREFNGRRGTLLWSHHENVTNCVNVLVGTTVVQMPRRLLKMPQRFPYHRVTVAMLLATHTDEEARDYLRICIACFEVPVGTADETAQATDFVLPPLKQFEPVSDTAEALLGRVKHHMAMMWDCKYNPWKRDMATAAVQHLRLKASRGRP